ncbi:unnamed protein product [Enterobius vermicularis]|uniref:C2 NT-type domain-containing protein n=1 Tax=Enterobius vermicularis TaxID=51028 RepID=A0A0N4UVQ4_ENTVE|nr:unnamed protein product [Enterobius vermicularis]
MNPEKRKSGDSFIRFRCFPDGALYSPSAALVEIGSTRSFDDSDSTSKCNSWSVHSALLDGVGCSRRSVLEPELRLDISVTQLDKRLRTKNFFMGSVLEVYRFIRFRLINLNDERLVGEAEVLFSQMVNDAKLTLKLYSRDFNGNPLFGASKRLLHSVGTLHINAFLDNSMSCSPSRGFSNNADFVVRDDDEIKESSNVMLASG